jgi:PAS domain S-box-containing protein
LAEADAKIAHLRAFLTGDATTDPTTDVARHRSHSLLAAVVTASHDAIVSSDEHHRITTWNPGAERIFGYTAAEAIGRNFSELIPADDQDERRNAVLDDARAELHDAPAAQGRDEDYGRSRCLPHA